MNKPKAIDIDVKIEPRKGPLEGQAWDVYVNEQWFVVAHKDKEIAKSSPVLRLFNGHQLFWTFNKAKAAEACGFKSYDCALPHVWLKEQAGDDMRKWEKIRVEHIWLYDWDRNGEPVNVLETLVTILNHAFEGVK